MSFLDYNNRMKTSTQKTIYVLLILLGIILPLTGLVPFLIEHGVDMPELIRQMFESHIATFFSWDLIISGVTLLFFMGFDEKRPKLWLIPTLGLFMIGVSFAFPTYALLRITGQSH